MPACTITPVSHKPLILQNGSYAAGEARKYVRRVLSDCGLGNLIDDACTIVSELVTNSVIHVRDGVVVVEVAALTPTAVIGVWDSSVTPPKPRQAADDMIGGRGLAIVDTLTHGQWGWALRPFGKIVHATVEAGS